MQQADFTKGGTSIRYVKPSPLVPPTKKGTPIKGGRFNACYFCR